jgi:hypothetical protein
MNYYRCSSRQLETTFDKSGKGTSGVVYLLDALEEGNVVTTVALENFLVETGIIPHAIALC